MVGKPNLSRSLVLEVPERDGDGAGGALLAWAVKGALWAEVTALPPRFVQEPGGPRLKLPLRVVVRGAPQGSPRRPRPGDRLREGARLLAVDSVAEADAEGRFLLCLCHEEQAA